MIILERNHVIKSPCFLYNYALFFPYLTKFIKEKKKCFRDLYIFKVSQCFGGLFKICICLMYVSFQLVMIRIYALYLIKIQSPSVGVNGPGITV